MRNNILIFTDWYFPGYRAGGPIRSLVNFTNVMKDFFEIKIVTSNTDFGEKNPYSDIEADKWIEIDEHVRIIYINKKNLSIMRIYHILKQNENGILYLNSLYSISFSIIPLLLTDITGLKNRIIISPRGMLQKGALANKSFKKYLFLQLMKISGIHKRIRFHATDLQEKMDIQKVFRNNSNINVIPNFISKITCPANSIVKSRGSIKLVCISIITIMKNLHFLLEILNSCHGEVELDIYGTVKDGSYFKKCQEIIMKLNQNITVRVNGDIENSLVQKKLSEHHFFILPTLGENFGHAIFESLNAGRPVIISDLTPWRNLEKSGGGWDISLNDKNAWISTLQKCIMMGQEEYNKLSALTYSFARLYAEQPEIIEKYEELFNAAS